MDRSGGKKDAIARLRLETVQILGDGSGLQGGAHLAFADARIEARVNAAAGFGVENEPSFGLAALARPKFLDGLFVGMHLDGEPIGAVQEFNKNWKC